MPRKSAQELTEARVDRLRAGVHPISGDPTDQAYTVWCRLVRGFGVQVTPHGTKTFYFKYLRPSDKHQVWMNLGSYLDKASFLKARAKAIKCRSQIEEGLDPKDEDRKANRKVPTVREYAASWLERREKDVRDGELSESTIKGLRYAVQTFIIPMLGHLRMDELAVFHVQEFHDSIADGRRPGEKRPKKDGKRTPAIAGQAVAYLSSMIADAERDEHRPLNQNPCKRVRKARLEPKTRFLSAEEITWVHRTLDKCTSWDPAIYGPQVDPYAVAAFRLLLNTGARKSEILNLRWSDVNWERRELVIEAHKTRRKTGHAKVLPITPEVETILKGLEALPSRHLGSEWVIQGARHRKPMRNLWDPWVRIKKAIFLDSEGAVNPQEARVHDLRHTFASWGVTDGLSLPIIGGALGHTNPGTTARYAHLALEPLRAAMERVQARINAFKEA